MASGDAAGCDNTGESGTEGLLAFLSLGVSSFGPSSRRKGSGKKRASGDFIAQDTAARGSVTFYKIQIKEILIVTGHVRMLFHFLLLHHPSIKI